MGSVSYFPVFRGIQIKLAGAVTCMQQTYIVYMYLDRYGLCGVHVVCRPISSAGGVGQLMTPGAVLT